MTDVQILNPIEYTNWDSLLETSDQTTFFHTTAWARVLSESYGYKPLYFTIIENDKLAGLIPVMEIDSWLTGKRGVSLPFTDECHPFAKDEIQFSSIFKTVAEYGKKSGWKAIEIRGGNSFLKEERTSSKYYTHNLDLNRKNDKIYSGLRGSNKRNIKRAQNEGVEVEISKTRDAVYSFYGLNCLTRKLHGLPPQPLLFFENIYENVMSVNKGFFALARFKKNIIAGAVYFLFNGNAIYKYGASNRNHQHLRPNNLVMWNAIKWCIDNGLKKLSFGRTETENLGLRQFKKGWGAKENVLQYYRYDLKKNQFVDNTKTPKSSYAVFKHLPLPVMRLTGNLLYKHVG